MALTVNKQALGDTPEGAAAALAVAVTAELNEIKYQAGGALQPQIDQLIGELRGVAAGMAAPPAAGWAPVNVTAPYVSQSGSTLSSTSGTWADPPPDSYEYEWQRNGSDVATGSTYDVQPGDVGVSFTCTVMAVNAAGSTPSVSNVVVAA